jgi:hypothetical protein
MKQNKKQNREQKKEKKNHTWKKMRFALFFQTSNLHLIKQNTKVFKKLFLL